MSLNTYQRRKAVRFAALVVSLCGVAQSHAAETYAGTPFSTSPFLIAAKGESKLEAENFDRGAEGIAYHDTDAINAGKQLRANDGVDIGLCNDVGGGYRVGWIAAGEWLKYTVRVSTAGKYSIVFRTSSRASAGAGGAKLHIEDEAGTNLTGEVTIPGSSDAWQDVRSNSVSLPAGEHVLKLVFDSGGFNLNYMTFAASQGEAAQAPVVQGQPGQHAQPAQPAQPDMGEVVVVSEEAGTPAGAGNAAATGRLGVFADENSIGTGDAKGQVSYAESGAYTLRGGTKIGGNADAMYFLSSKSQGDGQLVAKVESLAGAGSGGVMYRESAAADSRFAAVLVSSAGGTVFQRRSETGAAVFSATAMGAKPPVWIRLVRAGTNYSAFFAASAEQPGDGEWKQIGSVKAVAIPDEALAGLAAATGEGSAVLASVSAGVAAPANVDVPVAAVVPEGAPSVPAAVSSGSAGQLTGRVIGTEGSYDNVSTREKAFDGDLNTFFDPKTGDFMNMWTGLDLGAPKHITRIGYAGRSGFEHRTAGAKFQGSNSPTFASGVVDLYTIPTAAERGRMMAVDIKVPGAFRYVRYIGGTQHCNVAEIQFFGESAAGAAQMAATGAALTGSYADPAGTQVNLSEGALDWVFFGREHQMENRKANVPQRIGKLDVGGAEVMYFVDNHVKYTWTDGTPVRNVTDCTQGVFISTGAFKLSVRPGDTKPHVLTVYVGGFQSSALFTATLPGTPKYTDGPRKNTTDPHFFAAYTLNLRAASPGDSVTVEWKPAEGAGGNIQFHAAQLR